MFQDMNNPNSCVMMIMAVYGNVALKGEPPPSADQVMMMLHIINHWFK